MSFDKQYKDWQIGCIKECNRIYDTEFVIENMDKQFEVCEHGAIHVYGGGWYEGLMAFE